MKHVADIGFWSWTKIKIAGSAPVNLLPSKPASENENSGSAVVLIAFINFGLHSTQFWQNEAKIDNAFK
jgi:hypothetical protein